MKRAFAFMFLFPTILFARDFQTERPTRVRTPYTINKADFAVESEIANYRDDEESGTFETNLLKSLFRFGITPHTEIQAELNPYSKVNRVDGLGETKIGFKQNVLGNDDGNLSIAYGAFLEFPTSGANLNREEVEGALFIPMSYEINKDWSTAMRIEVNNIPRQASWQTNFAVAYAVSYSLTDNGILIVELFNEMGLNADESNNTTFDTAFQYSVSNNLKMDVGFFKGLSPDAKDEEVYTGLSYLFN